MVGAIIGAGATLFIAIVGWHVLRLNRVEALIIDLITRVARIEGKIDKNGYGK